MKENDYSRFTGELFDEFLQDVTLPFESEIDLLYNEVGKYRKSSTFKEILDFCNNFRHIAPFNAMLINIQYPGSKYALTSKQWREQYNRGIKHNAQPLIYLNMTPVGTLYDIGDTFSLDDKAPDNQKILDYVAHPFKTDGKFDETILSALLENLKYFGIAYAFDLNASDSYGAYIEKRPVLTDIIYKYQGSSIEFKWEMPYFISINSKAGSLQRMQSLCHELGHFFCHHLPPVTKEWWERRHHDKVIREFEAESVAYMVCKRNGIPCPNSEAYLAQYVDENEEIPKNISVEAIMKAVRSIERMLGSLSWSDGFLYNYDSRFKDKLKDARKMVAKKKGRN